MPIATNPDTGDVMFLDEKGSWSKAQTAVNPETKEMSAFDGKAWAPVPAQGKGIVRMVDDAVRSIASGITFGWADEFAAKMDEMTGRTPNDVKALIANGGKSVYEANLAKERARDAQIPISIKLPGEIAGAVGSTVLVAPLGIVRGLAAASAHFPQWMRFGALGAAEGSLAGAGGAVEGERLQGAATGAAVGAPVGAVAPSVVNGLTSIGRGIRNAVSPEAGAVADIGRAVVRDDMTPATLADRFIDANAQRPGVANIADAGGENVRGLVERVAQTPGAGRTTVIPALTARQEQQLGRISTDLQDLTGSSQTARQATEEVVATRAAAASPLYNAAYEAGDVAVWSPTLERLSSSPTVRDAMRGAVRTWQDNAIADGFGAANPGAVVSRGGQLEFLQGQVPVFPNIQFWDYTKRIIDDQIGAAVRAGQDQKARTLTRLNQVLRNDLDTLVPEYRAAREAWAGPSAYINAVDEGRAIMSKTASADEMGAVFRALSPSEQEGYRVGAVSSIISKMGNDASNLGDMTKYLRSPEMRAKIAAIMPTPEAAAEWSKRLGFEVGSSKLTGQSLGNSATARRLAEREDGKGIVGDLVMDAMLSGPASVSFLRSIFTTGPKWLRDTLRSRTDKAIGDILMNPERAGELPAILERAQRARAGAAARPTTNAATTAGGVVTVE